MIVPRVDFNSKIMQCHTCGKDVFYKVVCPEPALVFDDAHDFRASYGMFYTHPDGGNFLVVFLVLPGKLFPFGLLDRLYDFHPPQAHSLGIPYLDTRCKTQGKNTLCQPSSCRGSCPKRSD